MKAMLGYSTKKMENISSYKDRKALFPRGLLLLITTLMRSETQKEREKNEKILS
jgi:hypothetical protein